MNANFTLPKHVDFTFDIEGVDGEFTIPAIGALNTEQGIALALIQTEENLEKRHEKIKKFLIEMVPQLAEMGLGEHDYNIIFGAYFNSQNETEAGK